jgi:type I restriction enzyme S subunit
MPMFNENWRLFTVSDVAEIFDGPHATPVKTDEGPWFLSISSLQGGHLVLAESTHVSESDFVKWTRRVTPQPGDVLFSYETRLGEAALMPDGLRACLGRRMAILRPRRAVVSPRFLLYCYMGPEFQRAIAQRSVHGATVDRIPLVEMGEWPIRLPDRRTQEAIANVLGSLDDKIQANARQITVVGSMIRSLFLLSMEDPTVELRPLREVTRIVFGEPFTSSQFGNEGEGRPLIRIRDLKTFRPQVWTTESRTRETVVKPGDVVIGMDAEFRPTVWRGQPGLLNQRVCLAKPIMGSRAFVREVLVDALAAIESFKSGTTVSHLNRSDLDSVRLLVPPEPSRKKLDRQAEPLRELLVALHAESDRMERLRDTLLPKLISGELRVRDAEDELEAVG